METTDVVVVGAGPSGLTVAGDIANAGLSCIVLEKRAEESNLTRAFAVHARTLEQLDIRGLADELVPTGAHVDRVRFFENAGASLSGLPTRFPYVLIAPQYESERLLERRAVKAGAEIVNGAEVTGLEQDDEGVNVVAGNGKTYRAKYVVGADGVRSAVRETLGLPYPGHAVIQSMMLADVRIDETVDVPIRVNGNGDAFGIIVPFGDGWWRVGAWDRHSQLPDDAPVEFDELVRVFRRAMGDDFGMRDPRWLSRFHSDERQVPRYRVGRVFLVGDAAHCHSPAGGMGMNTGIQDAANLGWKLVEALNGRGGEKLLDSYHNERHPVGRLVLRGSGAIIRLAVLKSGIARTARNLVGGAVTRIAPVERRIAGMLSGIGIEYPAPHGAHRSVGHRIEDVELAADGPDRASRLYQALRAGRFVLLGKPSFEGIPDRVVRAEPAASDAGAGGGRPLTLVRPDAYVAWASDDASDREGFEHALESL